MSTSSATSTLAIDDLRLAYDVHGNGPLVVCLPGMGDLRSAYRHLAPLLVDAGLRVATLDLPGHGDSDVPARAVGQRDIARAAAALVERLGGPAIVVGHSFTPDSALLASQLLPSTVVGAVALGPWAATPRQPLLMRLAVRAITRTPVLWSAFYRSLHASPPADLAAHRRAIARSLRRPGGTDVLAVMGAGTTKDAAAARSMQRAPVAIIMGAQDPDFRDPVAEAETFAADLPGADVTVTIVDRAGHYPHAEQPSATAEAILELARAAGLLGAGAARA